MEPLGVGITVVLVVEVVEIAEGFGVAEVVE